MIYLKNLFVHKMITLVASNFKKNERIHEARLAGAFLALKAKWRWKHKLRQYGCLPGDISHRMRNIERHAMSFRGGIMVHRFFEERAMITLKYALTDVI